MKTRRIQDGPWCWVNKGVLNFINTAYEDNPVKARTARSIMLALAEVSSDNENKASFSSYRAYIANRANVSNATFDRYIKKFEEMKLVKKENHKNGKKNLANKWHLLDFTSIHNYDETNDDNKSQSIHTGANRSIQDKEEVINKHIKNKNEGIELLRKKMEELKLKNK